MRLGYVADSPLGRLGDEYYFTTSEWLTIMQTAPLFSQVDLCAYIVDLANVSDEIKSRYTFLLMGENITVHPLNLSDGLTGFNQWARKQVFAFKKFSLITKEWDFGMLLIPSYPSWIAWLFQKRFKWPYVVWSRADWVGTSAPRWPKNILGRLTKPLGLRLVRQLESKILYGADIRLTAGASLADVYHEIGRTFVPTFDTSLKLEDFRNRQQSIFNGRLVYVGSLAKRKGVDLLLKGFSLARNQINGLTLHIVGDGPERERLEELADELGISDSVVFYGYLPHGKKLLDFIYDKDVFLLTSYSEGFPRVVYEAMSQQLPVIVTRVGAVEKYLEHGQNAWLIEPGDPSAVANAIRVVGTNIDIRERLGNEGSKFARKIVTEYSVEGVVSLIEKWLSERTVDG